MNDSRSESSDQTSFAGIVRIMFNGWGRGPSQLVEHPCLTKAMVGD